MVNISDLNHSIIAKTRLCSIRSSSSGGDRNRMEVVHGGLSHAPVAVRHRGGMKPNLPDLGIYKHKSYPDIRRSTSTASTLPTTHQGYTKIGLTLSSSSTTLVSGLTILTKTSLPKSGSPQETRTRLEGTGLLASPEDEEERA